MRTIGCFVAATALILIGLGIWTVPTTSALVVTAGIEPSGMMASANNLPTSYYEDYSVVFN